VTAIDNDGLSGTSEVTIYVAADLPIVTIQPLVHCNAINNECSVDFTLTVDESYSNTFDWDFNNDGTTDQQTTGSITLTHVYPLNTGNQIFTVKYAGNIVFRAKLILANPLSDFNNDGSSDLLWHNSLTGGVKIEYMNGLSICLPRISVIKVNVILVSVNFSRTCFP